LNYFLESSNSPNLPGWQPLFHFALYFSASLLTKLHDAILDDIGFNADP